MELVEIRNGSPTTTSRLIAQKFGKDHAKVLRDIRKIECSNEFREANFGLSSYKTLQNKTLPEYIVTKDGFTLLVMGFTGAKAMQFKLDYIKAFNRMEAALKRPKSDDELIIIGLQAAQRKIQVLEQEKQVLADKVEVLTPYAEFGKRLEQSPKELRIGQAAKILNFQGLGPNKFFEYLRSQKIIGNGHGTLAKNEPYSKYVNLGYFTYKPDDTKIGTIYTPYITHKGLTFLYKQIRKTGRLHIGEQQLFPLLKNK